MKSRNLKLRWLMCFYIIVLLSTTLEIANAAEEGAGEKSGKKIDQGVEKIEKKKERMNKNLDDANMTATIKAEILSDPLLKVSQIHVTTKNGVVELTGTVDSQQSIDRAVQIAKSLKTVKTVKNELKIQELKK